MKLVTQDEIEQLQRNNILIHTSVKLVTLQERIVISCVTIILIHTSVKLVTKTKH